MRTASSVALVAALVALVSSCDSSSDADAGAVKVSVTTEGENLDADGYSIAIGEQDARPVAINGEATIAAQPGTHSARLTGLAQNCFTSTPNPVNVTDGRHQ
jgi:hypothetical protein